MPTEILDDDLQHKERNKRIPKDEVDLLGYDKLMKKVLYQLGKKHGQWVFDLKEELLQEGIIGLIKAHKAYDPDRGTFVTIAYLKIHTEMTRLINKRAREFVCMNNLEEIKFCYVQGSTAKLSWQELFPSSDVDYLAVAKLSIKEDDKVGWKLLEGLCNGVRKNSMHKFIGLSKADTERRLKKLKDDMIAVVLELYGDTENYK